MKLTPLVIDSTARPLAQEIGILEWFLENWTENPKKLVKMGMTIYNQIPEHFRDPLLNQMFEQKNPAKFIKDSWHELQEWNDVYNQMLADGYHGMISYRRKVEGVKLNVRPGSKWLTENKRWSTSDEHEIAVEAVDRWKIENKQKRFLGKIILFQEYGFSGEHMHIPHAFTDEFFEVVTADDITPEEIDNLLRKTPK